MNVKQGNGITLFTIPNIITLVNLILGLLAIVHININKELSYLLILGAAISDVMDGFVARLINQVSAIGRELDSLADIISFGVAPALLLISNDVTNYILLGVSAVYVSCGALRLARFNICGTKEFFQGLPIPAAALLTSSAIMYIPMQYNVILVFIIAILMISPVTYPSIKVVEGRKSVAISSSFGIVFALSLFIFYIFPSNFVILIAAIIFPMAFVYAFFSPIVFRLL